MITPSLTLCPTDIANYCVFCIKNMLFYYLFFHITGLPNFWHSENGYAVGNRVKRLQDELPKLLEDMDVTNLNKFD